MAQAHGDGTLSAGPYSLLLTHPIILLSGKGGVGKTTTAALVALARSRRGQRTLLVSTDPAHNLKDLFCGSSQWAWAEHLQVLEIDPQAETARYLAMVKANLRELVSSTMLEVAERQLDLAGDAPGAVEAAIVDRFVSVLVSERHAFDCVIFDTAPTGQTLRLLAMPHLMAAWVNGLLRHREAGNAAQDAWTGGAKVREDPVVELLRKRQQSLAQAQALLSDATVTAFHLVLVPEALAIAETRRTIAELAQYNIRTAGLVVNRILPAMITDNFFLRRRSREREYLGQIAEEFKGLPRIELPLLPTDLRTLEDLEGLLSALEETP